MKVEGLLPIVPGRIAGVVCVNPFIFQCPTCGSCFTATAPVIAAHCVPFWDQKRPGLRQCLACWADDGWHIGDYEKLRDGDPTQAHALLNRLYPGWRNAQISPAEAQALIDQEDQ